MAKTIPPMFTPILDAEVDVNAPVTDELLRKFAQNINFLSALCPVGMVTANALNIPNNPTPDPVLHQYCDGSEITNGTSPLRSTATSINSTVNLQGMFVRGAEDQTTNNVVGADTAELTIQNLNFVAKTYGPSGNDITIAIVDGGSTYTTPVATISSTAVTITAGVGYSTYQAIADAMNSIGGIVSVVKTTAFTAPTSLLAAAVTATNLAGGSMGVQLSHDHGGATGPHIQFFDPKGGSDWAGGGPGHTHTIPTDLVAANTDYPAASDDSTQLDPWHMNVAFFLKIN